VNQPDIEQRRCDLRQAIFASMATGLLDAPDGATEAVAKFADVAAALALQLWQARDAERLPVIPSAQEIAPVRPARCADIREARCAVVSEDARLARANFEDPHAWQCVGCAVRGSGAAVEGAE
jgi:hypothetical protein